jgi:hypothetical protein
MSALEKGVRTGPVCDATLSPYIAGHFNLYKYKKYGCRLVLRGVRYGFFGGDPDNFTYTLQPDAFLRIYENDKPVELSHYLKWRLRRS